jgi:hypothetical protein
MFAVAQLTDQLKKHCDSISKKKIKNRELDSNLKIEHVH